MSDKAVTQVRDKLFVDLDKLKIKGHETTLYFGQRCKLMMQDGSLSIRGLAACDLVIGWRKDEK